MAIMDVFTRNSTTMRRTVTLVMLYLLGIIDEVMAGNNTQSSRPKQDEQGDMLKGLAFGFGGFFGFIILMCLWWRCCCSSGNDDSCSCCERKKQKQKQRQINGRQDGQGRGRIKGEHNAKVSPSPPSSAMSWSRNS